MSNEQRSRSKRKFVKRAPNYSDNEKRFIVDRILRSYPVILDKRVDNRTKQQKARAWEHLAAEFNSQGVFVNRNPTTLRTCWENLKRLKKNDCIRSVLDSHLIPKKPSNVISDEGIEIIDLDGQQQNPDEDIEVKKRHLTFEVKIDEDVIFIPNPDNGENEQKQDNDNNGQSSNTDPLSEPTENFNSGNVENADLILATSTSIESKEKKREPVKPKKTAVKRSRVTKRRPINIRNVWIKKEIELFKTLKQHAEVYGKMLVTKKIELFQTLKNNAEEEGKIKQLILAEQLKQEKIRTLKMESLV